jgi:hypothetical protein
MPLSGVRATDELLTHAAEMPDLATEPLELPGVEVLQVMFEIDDQWMQRLLPPALHPTIPPTATFVFWRATEGPLGAFQMAQVRAGCRAGVRPRGLPLATWCDSEEASRVLRERWGFNCRPGQVRIKRNYDRITGIVGDGDRPTLQVALIDPQAISGADVQYTANMNLARVGHEGALRPWLVQVDPDYTFRRAERGRPVVERFERDQSTSGVMPVYPVSATYTTCDITLPRIRYISDPDKPAMQGTQAVNA